jgi:RNAse (barnase) inhibitor barstar
MPLNKFPFVFYSEQEGMNLPDAYVATLPSGLSTRQMLFAALQKQLGLPSYFGGTWDALSECLRDLSWIGPVRVAIVHQDLPSLGTDLLKVYLDLLADCVSDWKPNEDHELIVAFPQNSFEEIRRLMVQRNPEDTSAL